MAFLLNKAKDLGDSVTGKKKLQAESSSHEETKKQLQQAQEELAEEKKASANLREQVEHLELELSHERAQRMDAQRSLQAKIDAEEEAKQSAAKAEEAKHAAEEALKAQSEASRKQALLDAQKAYDSMQGLTVKETKLSESIALQTYQQNQVLRQVYISNYGKDLYKLVKSHTDGHLRMLLLAILDGPLVYQVETLKEAMSGIGCNEGQLISILCASTNAELVALKAKFKETTGKELIERVEKATSGDVQKLLIAILQCTRSQETKVDDAQVNADCAALYSAGQGKTIGHDSLPFISVLSQRSPAHLAALNNAYKKSNKREFDLTQAIATVFGGNMATALLTIMQFNIDSAVYFYSAAESAMKGIGCDSVALIDILIRIRETPILAKVKTLYASADHKRPFVERVKEELGGDTGKAATMLLGEYSA